MRSFSVIPNYFKPKTHSYINNKNLINNKTSQICHVMARSLPCLGLEIGITN